MHLLQLEPSANSHREISQVTSKSSKYWGEKEKEILKKIFSDPLNKMGIKDIASLLGRSEKSIERKKEKMHLGSSRQTGRTQKSHLTYPETTPGASFEMITSFNLLEDKARCNQLFLPFLRGTSPQKPTHKEPTPEKTSKKDSLSPKEGTTWTTWDLDCLTHYWGLRALGVEDIIIFLKRTIQETQAKAQEIGLPPKDIKTPTTKYHISPKWNIDPTIVTHELTNDEQHALAELTATRLSHLQTNPHTKQEEEQATQKEINSIFEIQRHIFHRAIRTKAKKLASLFSDSVGKEKELIQIGESSLFEVISRWNPADKINFCRATVAQNIERQMQQWLRSCRLVKLPSGLIQEIVEERKRRSGKDIPITGKKTLQREASIERYLYSVHPEKAVVPLNETHEENEDTRVEQITGGQKYKSSKTPLIEPEHQSFCDPQIEKEDMRELLGKICLDLPEEERYAFCQYHGIGEDGESISHKNLRELAAECNVSAERIRQRINLAKEKMLKKLARAGIRSSRDAF